MRSPLLGAKGGEQLKAFGVGGDDDFELGALFCGGDITWVITTESGGGEFIANGGIKLDGFAVFVDQGVGFGVEGEIAGEGEGGRQFGGGDKGVGFGIAVIALGEVAVEGGDNRIGFVVAVAVAHPLPDAGAAGVGHDNTADAFEVSDEAIAFDGLADLFGAGGNEVFGFGFELFGFGLFDERGGAHHIFVGRVGAGADEGDFDLFGPALGFGNFFHF